MNEPQQKHRRIDQHRLKGDTEGKTKHSGTAPEIFAQHKKGPDKHQKDISRQHFYIFRCPIPSDQTLSKSFICAENDQRVLDSSPILVLPLPSQPLAKRTHLPSAFLFPHIQSSRDISGILQDKILISLLPQTVP